VAAPISLFERKRKGQNIFSHELADLIAQILASLTEGRRVLIRLVPKMLTGVEEPLVSAILPITEEAFRKKHKRQPRHTRCAGVFRRRVCRE
jgi:hypothetical protein